MITGLGHMYHNVQGQIGRLEYAYSDEAPCNGFYLTLSAMPSGVLINQDFAPIVLTNSKLTHSCEYTKLSIGGYKHQYS